MNKYIIKNCPCYTIAYHCKYSCSGKTLSPYCQDCDDCVMKQIVKECTNSLRFSCERILAEKLLGLLDIQEIK